MERETFQLHPRPDLHLVLSALLHIIFWTFLENFVFNVKETNNTICTFVIRHIISHGFAWSSQSPSKNGLTQGGLWGGCQMIESLMLYLKLGKIGDFLSCRISMRTLKIHESFNRRDTLYISSTAKQITLNGRFFWVQSGKTAPLWDLTKLSQSHTCWTKSSYGEKDVR